MFIQRTTMCFKIISIIANAYLFTRSFHMDLVGHQQLDYNQCKQLFVLLYERYNND